MHARPIHENLPHLFLAARVCKTGDVLTSETGAEKGNAVVGSIHGRLGAAIVVSFSILYFADILLRASAKYFWYDEFFTLYLCRLPDMRAISVALKHGLDFNPPLFYVLTRASQSIFGGGQIGIRLPEIVGFWVLCIGLYVYVRRRSGALSGFVAMLFPLLTAASFYAYDARPHAVVLGFCGLALLCWQSVHAAERNHRTVWLLAFSVCLFFAFFTHCYAILIAIPFGAVELFRTLMRKRVEWPIWVSLMAPSLLAILTYIPLLRSFHQTVRGAFFNPTAEGVLSFYVWLLLPALPIVLFFLVLAFRWPGSRSNPQQWNSTLIEDTILALSFAALPLFGFLVSSLMQSPFVSRYFSSAVVGFSLLIGLGAGAAGSRSLRILLPAAMACGLLVSLGRAALDRFENKSLGLVEPSTKTLLSTTPGKPLANYPLLTSETADSLPIATNNQFYFIFLAHYAPALRDRLFFVVTSPQSLQYRGFLLLREFARASYNQPCLLSDFLRNNPAFLVYSNRERLPYLAQFLNAGGRLNSLKFGENDYLAEVYGVAR